ncbi:MAG: class I SAM-dependent methyltransferase [Chroococcidiopsidaceae cyanobacterium CP_BM_ER_R8_30]|nr:class I SAM-dependent methyltransferase [Chroococcidiopsidaceae cyanobacterium CP_BM_ER_R8_30]
MDNFVIVIKKILPVSLKKIIKEFTADNKSKLVTMIDEKILPKSEEIKLDGSVLDNKDKPVRYISTLEALDREIAAADEQAKISDDQLRQALSEFCYAVDSSSLPSDPYSQEYYDTQMKLYLDISGKKQYAVENEHVDFDFERLKNNPYPYCTKSPTTVGDHLIAEGFVIKIMNLAPGSHIVEFGPGWGNTTLHFAQMDYKVTAVDSEQSFIDLIKYRTEKVLKKVNFVKGDMLEFSSTTKYNAAVFFSCFHHCSNHLKLLKNLHDLIDDQGLVAFAAEPVADFPYQWGVRLEGMSVWSIRKFGWLELGFNTSYFMKTLLLLGWTPKRYSSDASPLADVIIARKSHMYYELSEITLPPDECKTWAPPEADSSLKQRFTGAHSVITCQKDVNVKWIEFCLSNYAPLDLDVKLGDGHSTHSFRLDKHSSKGIYRVPSQNWSGQINISSQTWCPAKVYHNGDSRELGVAVHYFRLID